MRFLEILLEYKTPEEALKVLLALWRQQSSDNTHEAQSSKKLYNNVLDKIVKEFGKTTATQMAHYVQSGKADQDDVKLEPAKRDSEGNIITPAQKLKWSPNTVQSNTIQSTHQAQQYYPDPTARGRKHEANGITLESVMRMINPNTGATSNDKIWGYARKSDSNYLIFDGIYGKQLDIRLIKNESMMNMLQEARNRLRNGYQHVDETAFEYGYIINQLSAVI